MGATVTDVPGIMRANGLNVGARTMSRWFSLPSNNRPEAITPQFDLVTMEFVRSFSGARDALDDAIGDKLWLTANAKKFIIKMLHRRGKLAADSTQTFAFDNIEGRNPTQFPEGNWREVDRDTVQFLVHGSQLSAISDFKATLGRATFQFNISGSVVNTADSAEVTIDRVGIYVRDSFDFNDEPNAIFSQPLGYWEEHTNYVGRGPMVPHCHITYETVNCAAVVGSPVAIPGCSVSVPTGTDCFAADYLSNADFRAYRAQSGMGGDFLIISDIEHVPTNDTFTVTKPSSGWAAYWG